MKKMIALREVLVLYAWMCAEIVKGIAVLSDNIYAKDIHCKAGVLLSLRGIFVVVIVVVTFSG